MPYVVGVSEYNSPKPSNQIPLAQTIFLPGYTENKASIWAKEIKGGVHYVKYLSHLLVNNLYDGIFSSRREKGMLAYVEFLDDDTPHGKYYSLQTMPGLTLSDWKLQEGTTIQPVDPETVANLTARDLVVHASGKFVNVSDARTAGEITDGDPAYSRSFISDGTTWLRIYGIGDVDPAEVAANTAARHNRNNDTELKKGDNSALTADEIAEHLANVEKHREINDANEDGGANELYSSEKVRAIMDALLNEAKSYTYSQSVIDEKAQVSAFGIRHTFETLSQIQNQITNISTYNNNELAVVRSENKVYRLLDKTVSPFNASTFETRWEYYFDLENTEFGTLVEAQIDPDAPEAVANKAVSMKIMGQYILWKLGAGGAENDLDYTPTLTAFFTGLLTSGKLKLKAALNKIVSVIGDPATLTTTIKSSIVEAINELKGSVDEKVVKNANITGATKAKITYDAKGLVTGGADLVEADIPALNQSKITGLTTALASKQADLGFTPENAANKDAANGYAGLDSSGLVKLSQLPGIAITSVVTVGSQAAQLALVNQEGDVVIRTDEQKSYIRNAGTSGTMTDYTFIPSPLAGNTDQLTEGSVNLYFTVARVLATPLTGIADTAGALAATDTILAGFGKVKKFISDFATNVRAVVLTGLDLTSSLTVSATDTLLVAIGKLQTQITARDNQIVVDWASNTAYVAGKKVKARCNIYQCILNHTSRNTGNSVADFTLDYNDRDKWMLIAEGKQYSTATISGAFTTDLATANIFYLTTGASDCVWNFSNALIDHTYTFHFIQTIVNTGARNMTYTTAKFSAPLANFPILTQPSAYNGAALYVEGNLVYYSNNYYRKNATTASYVAGTLPTNATYWDLFQARDIISAMCLENGRLVIIQMPTLINN